MPIGDEHPETLPADLIVGTLPGGQIAFTVHDGDCGGNNGMQAAFAAVWSWVRDHGHETQGGPFEVYLFDETNTENIQDYRTEIGWMLQSA